MKKVNGDFHESGNGIVVGNMWVMMKGEENEGGVTVGAHNDPPKWRDTAAIWQQYGGNNCIRFPGKSFGLKSEDMKNVCLVWPMILISQKIVKK